MSCRAFCESNYDNAMYFTWLSQSHAWVAGHNLCFCKSSDAGQQAETGAYSGEICSGNTTPLISTSTSTTTSTTTSDDCLIEENIGNTSSDLNNGNTYDRQNDAQSCRSFCKSNYPTALYFTWMSPAHHWVAGREACFCKSSDAGRRSEPGVYFGEICRGSTTTGTPLG